MPWKVGRKTIKGWEILRADTGQVVGYSETKEKASASVRARYANSPEFNQRLRKRLRSRLFLALMTLFSTAWTFGEPVSVKKAEASPFWSWKKGNRSFPLIAQPRSFFIAKQAVGPRRLMKS